MKIGLINFLQNKNNSNIKNDLKRSFLSPLAADTVTFSGKRKNDFPYSAAQKGREVEALKGAINSAIESSKMLSAEELSEITGLDIYVVKLRLSTNGEIRQLVNDMKASYTSGVQNKIEIKAKSAEGFFELLQNANQKMTEYEMAFYLGLEKDEFLKMLEEHPNLVPLYEASLLKLKNYPLLEKTEQIKSIGKALKRATKKDTLESISKKTELSTEIIRGRINESDEFLSRAEEVKLYPPELYSDFEIEEQDSLIMDTLMSKIKRGEQMTLDEMAESLNLYPGVVLIRLKNNSALDETCNRMLGVYGDND